MYEIYVLIALLFILLILMALPMFVNRQGMIESMTSTDIPTYISIQPKFLTSTADQGSVGGSTLPPYEITPLKVTTSCESSGVSDSFDPTLGSNIFNSTDSIYSSFPVEKLRDNGYNFVTPLVSSCLSEGTNGSCSKNQEFRCGLTPHNERLCYWK